VESFIGKLWGESLSCEVFDTFWEAKAPTKNWRAEYNHARPHSFLEYQTPAPQVVLPTKTSTLSLELVQ
jgi:putative transposase